MSPIRQIHHEESKIAKLILDTSTNNDPYRQSSMTTYHNPLENPIYPSN